MVNKSTNTKKIKANNDLSLQIIEHIQKIDLYLGPAFSQLDKLLLIEPALKGSRSGVIHSRLLKYTQNHTACFTESDIGPRADPG